MSVVMRLAGSPHGPTPGDGQYLKDFDFEAGGGAGEITMTEDITQAKRFINMGAAIDYWFRRPECRPLRPDGLPNRPLSATHWEFIHV